MVAKGTSSAEVSCLSSVVVDSVVPFQETQFCVCVSGNSGLQEILGERCETVIIYAELGRCRIFPAVEEGNGGIIHDRFVLPGDTLYVKLIPCFHCFCLTRSNP